MNNTTQNLKPEQGDKAPANLKNNDSPTLGQKLLARFVLVTMVTGLLIWVTYTVGSLTYPKQTKEVVDYTIKTTKSMFVTSNKEETHKNPYTELLNPKKSEVVAEKKDFKVEEKIKLSEELSDRIEKQGKLPEHSPLGLAILGESQDSNKQSMAEILESLASELGSSQAIGTIEAIKKDRENLKQIENTLQSSDPEIVEKATKEKEDLTEEIATLEQNLRVAINKEGFAFSESQIKALCASPNGEDMVSMITAFQSLKIISKEMERRLRTMPTPDNAQKYYGAHCALLIALDKIQQKDMEKIANEYVPRADQIIEEANKTIAQAKKLLATNPKGAEDGLSVNQQEALIYNKKLCENTIKTALKTKDKLIANLEIINRANRKLGRSILAAKNSHMTMILHTESIKLDMDQSKDFDEIQALTLPEMAAINFSDPDRPEISSSKL